MWFRAFRFLQMAALGAYLIFLPVYLVERGLSLEQVGLVATVPVAVQLVSGILWGALADLRGQTKPFLIQALVVWAGSAFVLPAISSFMGFLVLGVCRALLTPMMEGLIVTSLFKGAREDGRGASYSGFAVWGSVGWAMGVGLGGAIARGLGTAGAFYFAGTLFLSASLAVFAIPEPEERVPEPTGRRGLGIALELFGDRRVLRLLLASLPLVLALNATSQFFPVRLREVGASPALIGAVYMVPAFLEIPVFLKIGKWSDRRGSRRPLLLLAAGVYVGLFSLISLLADPLELFVGYSLLEPLAWAPLLTGAFTLVAEIVPRRSWATGQTVFSLWMWSVGGMFGPLFGGFVAQRWGLSVLFSVLAAGALISFLLFLRLPGGPGQPSGPGSR